MPNELFDVGTLPPGNEDLALGGARRARYLRRLRFGLADGLPQGLTKALSELGSDGVDATRLVPRYPGQSSAGATPEKSCRIFENAAESARDDLFATNFELPNTFEVGLKQVHWKTGNNAEESIIRVVTGALSCNL